MASCKFEGGKYKGGTEIKAHFRHNDISPERRAIAKKKNKHIDLEKCKYNFSILGLSARNMMTELPILTEMAIPINARIA